jgi:hypothetical protein
MRMERVSLTIVLLCIQSSTSEHRGWPREIHSVSSWILAAT